MRSPFAGSFLHLSQNRNSSFFSCAGFLPAKDDPGSTFGRSLVPGQPPFMNTVYGGIAAILNLAMSRGRATTNQTFFAGEAPTVQRFTAHAQCFLLVPEGKTHKSDQLQKACFRSCLLRNKNKTVNFR